MSDLTMVAVERQLRAMSVDEYAVGIRDPDTEKMQMRRWSGAQVRKSVCALRGKNRDGLDIYIRPSKQAASGLVLVDDLEYADVERLVADGRRAACLIETSPENFQAWIKLHEPQSLDVRGAVAVYLMREYGGDAGAAKAVQMGRLAGFTNRKEKHINYSTGRRPWVIIRDWRGTPLDRDVSLALIDAAMAAAEADAQASAAARAEPAQADGRTLPAVTTAAHASVAVTARYEAKVRGLRFRFGDLSKIDFISALDLLRDGYSKAEVMFGMMHKSPGLKERKGGFAEEYVRRTVDRAAEKLTP